MSDATRKLLHLEQHYSPSATFPVRPSQPFWNCQKYSQWQMVTGRGCPFIQIHCHFSECNNTNIAETSLPDTVALYDSPRVLLQGEGPCHSNWILQSSLENFLRSQQTDCMRLAASSVQSFTIVLLRPESSQLPLAPGAQDSSHCYKPWLSSSPGSERKPLWDAVIK